MNDDQLRTDCAAAMGIPATANPQPKYDTDLNAAFTLVDQLKKEGWIISCHNANGDVWNVLIASGENLNYKRVTISEPSTISDPSLASAICRAFLEVKGKAMLT